MCPACHEEGRCANARANEERNRVFRDGIVPSDAHFQVELVEKETSDVVVGFLEFFTMWSCKELIATLLKRAQLQR